MYEQYVLEGIHRCKINMLASWLGTLQTLALADLQYLLEPISKNPPCTNEKLARESLRHALMHFFVPPFHSFLFCVQFSYRWQHLTSIDVHRHRFERAPHKAS